MLKNRYNSAEIKDIKYKVRPIKKHDTAMHKNPLVFVAKIFAILIISNILN